MDKYTERFIVFIIFNKQKWNRRKQELCSVCDYNFTNSYNGLVSPPQYAKRTVEGIVTLDGYIDAIDEITGEVTDGSWRDRGMKT